MDAAKAWGLPPWKVGGGSKTLWFARFEAVRDVEIKRADKVRKDLEKR